MRVKLEYRTVNVYRSALSAVLPLIDGHKAGCHPLVCQLLKGVFQLCSPQPRYATMWQVSKVIQCISSLGSNSNLSTKLLSYKPVGLLALTAPDRASGLAARDLRFRYFHPEGVQVVSSDCKSCQWANHREQKSPISSVFPISMNGSIVDSNHCTLSNMYYAFCYTCVNEILLCEVNHH